MSPKRATPRIRPNKQPLRQEPDAFLSRLEAAAFCRLDVQTIDKAVKLAHLRCYRVGRRVLLQKPDLLKWMARYAE